MSVDLWQAALLWLQFNCDLSTRRCSLCQTQPFYSRQHSHLCLLKFSIHRQPNLAHNHFPNLLKMFRCCCWTCLVKSNDYVLTFDMYVYWLFCICICISICYSTNNTRNKLISSWVIRWRTPGRGSSSRSRSSSSSSSRQPPRESWRHPLPEA